MRASTMFPAPPAHRPGLVVAALLGIVPGVVLLDAPAARAASPVQLSIEAPDEASYSQAVPLTITLTDADAVPLDGTSACGADPCVVEVRMQRSDGGGDVIDVTAPDVAFDAAGRARVRLTLVDGRHGGAQFESDPEGLAYTITAHFPGAGSPPPSSDACSTPVVDGRWCARDVTTTLTVLPEVPALRFSGDVVMRLGETASLRAELVDEDGDAEAGGEAIDGATPRPLAGVPVSFFYDVNDDGSVDPFAEKVGEVSTDDDGVARLDFTADPGFATAGVFERGLQAEFSGDARYGVARTAVRLTLGAGDPDPTRTIIEVTPTEIPADGLAQSTIRVRLIDAYGNVLGADAPAHDVQITSALGRFLDDVEFDVLDGTYSRVLQAQREGGESTIHVTIDGVDAGNATLTLVGGSGCQCDAALSSATASSRSSSSSPSSQLSRAAGVAAVTALAFLLSRRRRAGAF